MCVKLKQEALQALQVALYCMLAPDLLTGGEAEISAGGRSYGCEEPGGSAYLESGNGNDF